MIKEHEQELEMHNKDSNNVLCSIIVPLFMGEQLIDGILDMIKKCIKVYISKVNNESLEFELILINDYQDEFISQIEGDNNLKIVIANNKENKGIHYSRIKGLELSSGEFVLFLDQDDKITATYFVDQFEELKNNVMVACNGINYGIGIYNSIGSMERINDPMQYFEGINRIVSPGQVILRRDIIPIEWKENIICKNGSDDYFLWSLLMHKGYSFSLNMQSCFLHTQSCGNASRNMHENYKSAEEVCMHLGNMGIVNKEELKEKIVHRFALGTMDKEFSFKYYDDVKLFNAWLFQKNRDIKVADYLAKHNHKKVSIYGFGMVGQRLLEELINDGIDVKSIIDRRYKDIAVEGCTVCACGGDIGDSNAIIVTLLKDYMNIEQELKKHYKCKIMLLHDLIFNRTIWE